MRSLSVTTCESSPRPRVEEISRRRTARLPVSSPRTLAGGDPLRFPADLVLVVVGVRPDTDLAASAGVETGRTRRSAGQSPDAHQLPQTCSRPATASSPTIDRSRIAYLPLGTTAHKQGRVAGENAVGGNAQPSQGTLGTPGRQSLRVRRRPHRPPRPRGSRRRDRRGHRRVATPTITRSTTPAPATHDAITGDRRIRPPTWCPTRRPPRNAGPKAHRHRRDGAPPRDDCRRPHDLDLSYTPPLGSPWDALQAGAQSWIEHAQRSARNTTSALKSS